ncbi:CD209 antigen-like protein D [Archocentrus centrarchus]|uniref:CD209 antigen-like protein D n=1 Tax=Archocentrus centrarchus TaxID=63155 RepID=UPI0011E9D090|nr:CD209 antigen-like protein D [Archocentrus centrarchus]
MDQDYVNVDEILGHHRRLKREQKSSQDTSVNHEMIQIVQPETTRPELPDAEAVKSSCRAAAILLGLLSFFLLIGLIILGCLFTQGKSQWEMETVTLQKLYNNVTRGRNQLQANYNSAVKERDELQAKLQDCANWVFFKGSLYYVSSNKTSWQNSRQDCLQRGADLMIINSQEEQNFANQFKKYLWIGMTDSETEGSWKWVDGTPVTTRYWNSGEPNGGINENCGQIKNYNSQNSWNDENCSNLHFWICEKRASP